MMKKIGSIIKDSLLDAAQVKLTLEIAAGMGPIKGKEVIICKGSAPSTLKFKTTGLMGQTNEYLVKSISWQEQATRNAGKAAAGAIVGGALTGGAGLIVGAAIGGRSKDNSVAVLVLQMNTGEGQLYLRCSSKEYEQLTSL